MSEGPISRQQSKYCLAICCEHSHQAGMRVSNLVCCWLRLAVLMVGGVPEAFSGLVLTGASDFITVVDSL